MRSATWVDKWNRYALACTVIALAGNAANNARAERSFEVVDTLITNALVIDGTGEPGYEADVAIESGKILRIGKALSRFVRAHRVVDAAGRVLAPGFIDIHAHGDALEDPWDGHLAMGVTTIALGQDGLTVGVSLSDGAKRSESTLAGWIEQAGALRTQLNVVPFSGHGTLRYQAGINEKRSALTAKEIGSLQAQLQADLDGGSFGLTLGLEYAPGIYAGPEELLALARTVGNCDALVMSHLRSEDDEDIEAVGIEELVHQGQFARVHISHLKVVYGKGVERAARLLGYIESIANRGTTISADIYPYVAGYTGVAILFPEWSLPPAVYEDVVKFRRDELAAYLEARVIKRNGPEALLFGSEPFVGLTLEEASAEAGVPFVDFLIMIGPGGGEGAHFTQDESTHNALVVSPLTAISTDGGPGIPHPRSTGTYAKLIAHFVRETGQLAIEEAIRKATGLPASILMLEDRGLIKEGAHADLVMFDPARVQPRSDYLRSNVLAKGFDLVYVNGAVAWEGNHPSPGRHGQVLKHACK